MEGVFYMQSSTFGRLCITQRIDLRGTYNCPKKEVHYTDIDLIALDKGEISVKKIVDQLMDKMEQYANFGFSYMQEKWRLIRIISSKRRHSFILSCHF